MYCVHDEYVLKVARIPCCVGQYFFQVPKICDYSGQSQCDYLQTVVTLKCCQNATNSCGTRTSMSIKNGCLLCTTNAFPCNKRMYVQIVARKYVCARFSHQCCGMWMACIFSVINIQLHKAGPLILYVGILNIVTHAFEPTCVIGQGSFPTFNKHANGNCSLKLMNHRHLLRLLVITRHYNTHAEILLLILTFIKSE